MHVPASNIYQLTTLFIKVIFHHNALDMPAKATLYNLKGDVIYDFGTGPRNEAHFDPFGKDKFLIINYAQLRTYVTIYII